MKYKCATIINDCHDQVTAGRQTTRVSALLDIPTNFIGVESYKEIEAAGAIIDVLDAFDGQPGIIIANSAPRHGNAKKWKNGSPFCYFEVDGSLVISTIDGTILSLVKKFDLVDSVNLLDIPEAVKSLVNQKVVDQIKAEEIINTQFRSFNFTPRLAKWLSDKVKIPSKKLNLNDVPNLTSEIWWIDNFGDCKTSLLPEEINFKAGKEIKTLVGKFKCYERMKDVPNNEPALIIGSSGYKKNRLIELIIQGDWASDRFNLSTGDKLI